jgi:hypothetical protein
MEEIQEGMVLEWNHSWAVGTAFDPACYPPAMRALKLHAYCGHYPQRLPFAQQQFPRFLVHSQRVNKYATAAHTISATLA